MAAHDGDVQPVIALWSDRIADDLDDTLAKTNVRSVEGFAQRRRRYTVSFEEPGRAFLNINTPEDLTAAHALLSN